MYLSPILDMYNGEIIAYDISRHPDFKQTMDMLDRAFEKIPDNSGAILHSDQGLAVSDETLSAEAAGKRNCTEHVQERELLR